jgi:hypothetical protein
MDLPSVPSAIFHSYVVLVKKGVCTLPEDDLDYVYRHAVSPPELVYPSGCRFYWSGLEWADDDDD